MPDFPFGLVVKNPPANAGDMGSISGPGRSHLPLRGNYWIYAQQLLKPLHPRAHAPQQEKPSFTTAIQSPHAAMKNQHSHK